MAARVTNDVVVEENDVVLHVTLKTEEEARLHVHIVSGKLLCGGGLVSRHRVYLLRGGGCLHHTISFVLFQS